MNQKEYYLGLDMGTSSVGWAVTDEKYHLLRAKGKDLWGIREFDEASTSVERRMHRTSRRRRQREQVRIGLLKDYFQDAIFDVDPHFYQRMANSKYHLEDKDDAVKTPNGLFNDKEYKDKDYFEEYPTIFHLRSELIHNAEEHDVRFVYLALLHMFKHRGHFLNVGLSDESNSGSMLNLYTGLCELLEEKLGIALPSDIDPVEIEKVLGDRDISRTKKSEKMFLLMRVEKKEKQKAAIVKALCGLNINAQIIFADLEEDKKVQICFSDFGYEDKVPELTIALGEENFEIVESMKAIYDQGMLAGIMKGYEYLSDARIAEYEKHRKDLRILKNLVKKYGTKQQYHKMFRSEEKGSYSAYVNSYNSGDKYRRNMKERKAEHLYKSIKDVMKKMPENDSDVCYVKEELEKETFLPKQMTAANGVIPYQAHSKEMKKILENAEGYLSFLSEKDETGLSVSQRILKLFEFQIPYYVGPVSKDSKTGWVVRKAAGQVLPWNLEEKIDLKATSEGFISNLVRKCTYMNDEQVLPKASLLYESYCVLNEINNIRIDGEKIDVSLKQDIYKVLFERGKKVSRRQLVNYLRSRGCLESEEQLSGVDSNINNALISYGKFYALFGERMREDVYKKMAEDIIFWCTVYGESKKFLKQQLNEKYGTILTEEQIKRIMGFKFKDWGRLSKEFLLMEGIEASTEEVRSLIRTMWETNYNLMELIHSEDYTYQDALDEKQNSLMKTLSDIQPDDLDEYYFSAPVKRMVWQTLLIIRELESVLGAPPKRIFVEMTRGEDDRKERTIPRKQQLLELYKNIKKEEIDWKNEIEKADAGGKLRSKKMYLYFKQMGRCLYTGKSIDLDQLFNDNLYDIDHIYPRHFVKDDNLENNLVLVEKTSNAYKSDTYPLDENVYHSQKAFWKELRHLGLMSEEKYKRLTCRSSFTDEQKANFIARQLVETSQGTKSVATLLKQMLPETQVVYSKASNVARFRENNGFVKCRLVNDFHHAQDAYLNIIVGNVYFVKFTQNPLNFIKDGYRSQSDEYKYHLYRMFDWDVKRGGEIAWIASSKSGKGGTIETVRNVMSKNTPLMTRMNFTGHGGIADQTLYSAKKASREKYISLKESDSKMTDVTRYGGFSSVSTAYFALIEHGPEKKRVRSLEAVPVYLVSKIEGNDEGIMKYCTDTLGLIDPVVRLSKIKIQSLIKKDGFFYHITGRTGNRIILRNAVNLCLMPKWMSYIKEIENYKTKGRIGDKISAEDNVQLYDLLIKKHTRAIYSKRANSVGEKLIKYKDVFSRLNVERQCEVIFQLLKLTAIGSEGADLTIFGEGKTVGKMKISNTVTTAEEFKLISQSSTGLFTTEVDLLKV